MMRFVALALILGLAGASSAQAGAWLREKGKGFAATSLETAGDDENSASFYFEYGLTERVTFGADISYDTDILNYLSGEEIAVQSIEELPEGSGILFLRFPLGPTDKTNKWAFHVGVGARYLQSEFLRAAEIGLSWGRGFQWGDRYGWMNIDTSYNAAESPAEERIKLDGTIGLGLTEKTKVMLQLFNTFEGDARFTKIAPSLLFAVGDKGATVQLGGEIPVDDGDARIKLGIWLTF